MIQILTNPIPFVSLIATSETRDYYLHRKRGTSIAEGAKFYIKTSDGYSVDPKTGNLAYRMPLSFYLFDSEAEAIEAFTKLIEKE